MIHFHTIVGVILILGLIIYTGILFWAYRSRKWIFSPYIAPAIENSIQPHGLVRPATLDEVNARRALYGLQPLTSI